MGAYCGRLVANDRVFGRREKKRIEKKKRGAKKEERENTLDRGERGIRTSIHSKDCKKRRNIHSRTNKQNLLVDIRGKGVCQVGGGWGEGNMLS